MHRQTEPFIEQLGRSLKLQPKLAFASITEQGSSQNIWTAYGLGFMYAALCNST